MARGGTSAQGTGGKKRKQPGKQVDVVEISSSYEGGDGAAAARCVHFRLDALRFRSSSHAHASQLHLLFFDKTLCAFRSDRERADYELALQLQQEDIARALTEATSPPGPAAHSEPTSTHSAKRLKISEAELADPSEGASEKAEAPLTGVERRRDGESVDAYFLRVAQLRAMEVLQGKKIRPASEIDAEVRKRDETAAEAGTGECDPFTRVARSSPVTVTRTFFRRT